MSVLHSSSSIMRKRTFLSKLILVGKFYGYLLHDAFINGLVGTSHNFNSANLFELARLREVKHYIKLISKPKLLITFILSTCKRRFST